MIRKYVIGTLSLGVFLAFILAMVLMVQLHRYGIAVDVARLENLQAWSGDDEQRQAQMQRYFEYCIDNHRDPEDKRSPEHIRSLYQCAEEHGSPEIAQVVRQAPNTVEAPAPLRWFW
ncbi:hypothetical protein [Marinobacter shengliensis]|uniref:hypothetical protein n=1 Tax=Marinobacter shengliensis TaxID=1389223 RepID=UPI000D0F61F5|nr:hypothetical protein [Marinobacter shengliensis]PSF12927.1 hypothetical protein C7H10_12090 [Marinobacter shengliensis]